MLKHIIGTAIGALIAIAIVRMIPTAIFVIIVLAIAYGLYRYWSRNWQT